VLCLLDEKLHAYQVCWFSGTWCIWFGGVEEGVCRTGGQMGGVGGTAGNDVCGGVDWGACCVDGHKAGCRGWWPFWTGWAAVGEAVR
jgi:hypothetical protein